MRRVDARRVVARVHHDSPRRDRAVENLIGPAVDRPTSSANRKAAIAVVIPAPGPLDATLVQNMPPESPPPASARYLHRATSQNRHSLRLGVASSGSGP